MKEKQQNLTFYIMLSSFIAMAVLFAISVHLTGFTLMGAKANEFSGGFSAVAFAQADAPLNKSDSLITLSVTSASFINFLIAIGCSYISVIVLMKLIFSNSFKSRSVVLMRLLVFLIGFCLSFFVFLTEDFSFEHTWFNETTSLVTATCTIQFLLLTCIRFVVNRQKTQKMKTA
jgi:hypothetical protein